MRPAGVVMLAPGPDFAPRIPQVPEPARIQALVSQPPVKTLYMPILRWLAGPDVNRSDLTRRKPRQIMATGEFRTDLAPDCTSLLLVSVATAPREVAITVPSPGVPCQYPNILSLLGREDK